ncbi:glycosyltransferase [Clostridium estertheticum]|uniref:glycosyltransferase n=1 Tax=Clostridium estertheticum TaxID=238834 RepID=UPI0013E97AAE|nr:glycosyltransferase [Clostridium estertheticum]MBZ9687732.1 glycosyltransferase [Clostridium estertheticum]
MKKILFVSNNQFGYLIDTLKYCEYLGELYEIQIVCVDNGLPKIENQNIVVHYIQNDNKYTKRIKFAKITKGIAAHFNPNLIFVDYFVGCSTIKLYLGNKYTYNLDIRTGAISKNKIVRKTKNLILKLEAYLFSNVSIISKHLQKHLKINSLKVHKLPLGADKNIFEKSADMQYEDEKLKLIYVGTLYERKIEQTILGISIFMSKYRDSAANITYDIIGYSKNSEDEKIIEKYIVDLNLEDVVVNHGKLEYTKAMGFVSKADIGISYIPITEYFNFQPPTKTFEYLLSGLPCIATNTFENAQIINTTNGILIADTPEGFCEGLNDIITKFEGYNKGKIVNSVSTFTWENIILNNLNPYLKSIIK